MKLTGLLGSAALVAACVPQSGLAQGQSELARAQVLIQELTKDLEEQSFHITQLEKELTPEGIARAWPAESELQGKWGADIRSDWGKSFQIAGPGIRSAGCSPSTFEIVSDRITTGEQNLETSNAAPPTREIVIRIYPTPDREKCDLLAMYLKFSIDLGVSHGWCARVAKVGSEGEFKGGHPGDYRPFCKDQRWRK